MSKQSLTQTVLSACAKKPLSVEVMIAKGETWAEQMEQSIQFGESEIAQKREAILEMESELSAMTEVVKRGKRIRDKFVSFFE